MFSLWLSTPQLEGQAVLSGTSWTENFDSLGSGLPTGWSVVKSASATSLGTAVAFTTATTNWSATSGEFANFASTSDGSGTTFDGSENSATQAASPNRCLGVRQTGSLGDPGAAFLFQIQDTMGFANFQLSLDLNMLSLQPRSTTWTIDYGIGSTPANFISLGTYTDPGTFGATRRTFSFGNALDNQSQTVWIRIVALANSTGSGSRDTFGIDNFNLSYTSFSDTHTAPSITTQPPSRTTNNAGTSVTFTVAASGTAPFTYQWFKDGDYIYDNGMNISGAATAALTLTGVLAADAGAYSVQVSNPYGHASSSNAVLVVIDPLITVQPVSRTNVVGDTANLSVTAVGTPLVNYQWRFNGKEIDSATDSLLSLDDVQTTNTGAYSVVVSDSAGSVTSTVAQLVVVQPPPNLLARWDFNDPSAPPSAPPPSLGTGTSTVVGSPVGS
ncbi:MAG TPA: immunoglobulin domain-containing protein, partial [Terriglobales bacterium]|nr:immunoglobulin domain-containing protein [Terriglobales bacterium]